VADDGKDNAMVGAALLRVLGGGVQTAILGGVGWTAVQVIQIPTINTKLDDHTHSIENVTKDLKDYSVIQQNFREAVIKKFGDVENQIGHVQSESGAHTQQLKTTVDTTSALTATVNQTNTEVSKLSDKVDKISSRLGDDENNHRVFPRGGPGDYGTNH
jgi:hypothetical protein